MTCRFCNTPLSHILVDLGATAVSNAFLKKDQLDLGEAIYPLKVYVCEKCFLVQVPELRKREDLFTPDYVYASSVSKSWLEHCRLHVENLVDRFSLGPTSQVMEIASNDGYLLQYFRQKNIPCLGIEPTQSTAELARQKGIETLVEFFDDALAERLIRENRRADVLIGNNVLAHVPDLNRFVRGMKLILSERGVVSMEFPHLLKMIDRNEFDTIYHEHYSYFSYETVKNIFAHHDLSIFDVEELPTHGGSLRIYAAHSEQKDFPETERAKSLSRREVDWGVGRLATYGGFQEKTDRTKNRFLQFLIGEKLKGRRIAGFGAAAKGNTFINYAGIHADLISYVVDDTPFKQGRYLPQSHIPVFPADKLESDRPDLIVILPWNFKKEIADKLAFAKAWEARLVAAIPELQVWPAGGDIPKDPH
ncbi:MAG: class I SAM-dependent methyltransferase [Spirochaetia bacterium]|nr:class I SAM-dependent methyltransferase [Spirochaetia bacterium]